MDTSSLVRDAIDDGRKLLVQLVRDGFDVTIAFWVRFQSEEPGPWFYIVSKAVDQKGLRTAYQAFHESLQHIPAPWRPWKSLSETDEIRLVGAEDPFARDVLALRTQFPGRNRFLRGVRIGNQFVAELVIYQYNLPSIFLAVVQLGCAKKGVPFLHFKEKGAATAQQLEALEILRKELGWNTYSIEEWIRCTDIVPEPIPVKELLRQAVEAVYPLVFPKSTSDREQEEARAFEKLGPVAWGLKAELERSIEQPGDWPELRQIWPEPAPRDGAKAH
ncbi:MAG: hypothetical protein ACYC3I_08925 [Gemmataceae bacterium]